MTDRTKTGRQSSTHVHCTLTAARLIRRSFLICLLTLAPIAQPSVFARDLQCDDLPGLFEIYLTHHLKIHELNDTIKGRTVDQFLKALDPSKTLFLEEDIQALRPQIHEIFKQMKEGNDQCPNFGKVHELLVKRVKEVEGAVKDGLGDQYKLDETTEITLNPDLRAQPKTAAERKALLTRMVHFNISNYLAADTKLVEAKRLLKKRYELTSKRTLERKLTDYHSMFAESFSHSLDPHSSYMAPDVLEDFQIQMQLSLDGIGASLSSEDGYTVIEELIPGGGADKCKKLKAKDKIIAVAQEKGEPVNVIDMDLRDVVKMIRGKKGTKVKLTILRQAEKTESFEVVIIRDKIDLKDGAAKYTLIQKKVNNKNYKIGLINLPSFYGGAKEGQRTCYNDVKDLVEKAKRDKVDGIVLDLSRNGGGLLDQAVKIAGLFIRKGGIVATQSVGGRMEILEDKDQETQWAGPIVVHTSRGSASASEIVAGALKDYHRAVIVGNDHTFGKGTVQVLAPLPNGLGAMKLTNGMFHIPSGISTQHGGVVSDINLPASFNLDEIGEKKLDYSLPQEKVPAFVSAEGNSTDPASHWRPITPELISKLAQASQARVNTSEKFNKIKKELEESLKNKGVIKLSELRKKQKEDHKIGKKIKKAIKDRFNKEEKPEDNAQLMESIAVAVDLITQAQ